jgi:hypothetical protein
VGIECDGSDTLGKERVAVQGTGELAECEAMLNLLILDSTLAAAI